MWNSNIWLPWLSYWLSNSIIMMLSASFWTICYSLLLWLSKNEMRWDETPCPPSWPLMFMESNSGHAVVSSRTPAQLSLTLPWAHTATGWLKRRSGMVKIAKAGETVRVKNWWLQLLSYRVAVEEEWPGVRSLGHVVNVPREGIDWR